LPKASPQDRRFRRYIACDYTPPDTAHCEGGVNTGPPANACQKEICASGICNSVSNPAANGQECNFGPTPGECQTDVCSNGACVLANANEGGACTTASPPPTQCQEQVCQSGTCVDVNIEPPPDVCVPKKIPTLSEWGMIMLGGLLALIGFATIRRREM